MILWIILGFISAALGVYLIYKVSECDLPEWVIFIAILLLIAGLVMLLTAPIERYNYCVWERQFTLIKNYLAESSSTLHLDGTMRVVDIATANAELAEYQARNQIYGIFSVIPDSVQTLTPIT